MFLCTPITLELEQWQEVQGGFAEDMELEMITEGDQGWRFQQRTTWTKVCVAGRTGGFGEPKEGCVAGVWKGQRRAYD